MFLLWEPLNADFWWWISLNCLILCSLSFSLIKEYISNFRDDLEHKLFWKVTAGIVTGIVLYGVFWVGHYALLWVYPATDSAVRGVYEWREGVSNLRVLLLILFVIGPGEEIFWRGCLQYLYMNKWGPWRGFLLATLVYSLIHLTTGNWLLPVAALTCGLVWGWLYMRYRSLVLNIVSHVVWDLLVFLVFPFM